MNAQDRSGAELNQQDQVRGFVCMDVTTQTLPANDVDRGLRFLQMFEAAACAIAVCHLDGRILEANPELGRLLGYERHELAGVDFRKFYGAGFQCLELHNDGSAHDNGDDSRDRNDRVLVAELMSGGSDSFTIEKRFRRKDGSEFWGRLTISLARDGHHDPAFLVALLADATEHKRLDENLRQAQKMEVMGRLAGGVAHDFNNLLTGILLYCDLLLTELEPEHRLRHHVEEVRMAGEQGAALTQQLLAMSRKQAAEPRALPINQVVSSTESLLRRLIVEHIELVSVLDPAAGMIFAETAKLQQVLLNLVLNARDAMAKGGPVNEGKMKGGKIRLSTRVTQFPRNLRPGNFLQAVSLTVADNGCGMNAETRAHLFEPFFTTKKAGEGTGIGLATVQRIVSEWGGLIEVASEPGRGTRIEVFFPALGCPRNVADPQLVDPHVVDSQLLEVPNRKGDSPC
jgi:two-component system cell cycle sensor histidine kinase/response regulator CckA